MYVINPGIALTVIKQFALEVGRKFHNSIGGNVNYDAEFQNLDTPLQKKARFVEDEIVDHEDRNADMVDMMSEEELLNRSMRKKLLMLRDCCTLDEEPDINQLIRQFSDNYENSPSMMFV